MKINCIAKSKMKDILIKMDDDVWLRSLSSQDILSNISMFLTYGGLRKVDYMCGTCCEIVFGFEI